MNMIERVARAIDKQGDVSKHIIDISNEQFTKELAKAAIVAMREPTEEMLELWHKDYVKEHTIIYQNMIDAALKE